ncbi:hypothetical protein C8J47_1201 [Sphingomonas sp. PP-F2F-G114-C0414]|nr:hypothetical protein C8J47_1201 [Sphingomonas sp. PP-F2F-G114-C0414]
MSDLMLVNANVRPGGWRADILAHRQADLPRASNRARNRVHLTPDKADAFVKI